MIIKTEWEINAVFSSSKYQNISTETISVLLPTPSQGSGWLLAICKLKEKRQRFPVAISHLICSPQRGLCFFLLASAPLSPSRLFARISESGFSKGTKETGARPIEPAPPPQEVINFKHSSLPAAGSSQPVGIKRRDSRLVSNFHQYRFIFSLAW